MREKNKDFLENLEENYKNFNNSFKIKNKNFEDKNEAANKISETSLEFLIKISEIISKKYGKGKENEDKARNVLQRFVNSHKSLSENLKKIGIEDGKIKSMDELLDEIILNIVKVLDQNSLKVPNIYREIDKGNKISAGSGEGLNKLEKAPKYEQLIKILNEKNIDFKNIQIVEEELDEKRMRKIPYKIVYIFGENPVTITISDEIGQATYVFYDNISPQDLSQSKKGESISGKKPTKIIYSEKFEENLKDAIFNHKNIQKENNEMKVNLNKELLEYHISLLNIIPELENIGLKVENGIFDFSELEGINKWPKLNGKKLYSFPSTVFNKKNGFGNEKGIFQNKKELAKLFQFLDFNVNQEIFEEITFNNLEEEKRYYKTLLENIIPKLEEIGLKVENGIFDFSELENINKWPKLNGKKLSYFPNTVFNKENGFGNEKGIIQNKKELAKLFQFLGFKVLDEGKLLSKYKTLLENIIPELEEIGLKKDENGILDFSDLKENKSWPTIDGKKLQSFPNAVFNKKYLIGNEKGRIQSKTELAKLFQFFDFNVDKKIFEEITFENFEEEKRYYKTLLENIVPELEKIGLKVENGIFDFSELENIDKWPKLNGKKLSYFPSTVFNKKYGIGNEKGRIQSKTELAKLFQFFDFNVDKKIFEEITFENFEEEKRYYKTLLENIIPELENIGLKVENGILNFSELKGLKNWPGIYGKNLQSFPNTSFNKENGIGNKIGIIQNKKELAKLFQFLGFNVDKKIFEDEKK